VLLAKEEGLLNAVIENAVDGVILIDSKGTIQLINPAACGLFGYEKSELIDLNVSTLMPTPHRLKHDEYIHSYHHTGKRNIIGYFYFYCFLVLF
jgi:two-component system, LuxR family, sensor kinase FixL